MPTPEVIALADEVQAHLKRGDLAGLGPVDLGPDGIVADAERAARIVLADVAHRSELEPSLESPTYWETWLSSCAALSGPSTRSASRPIAQLRANSQGPTLQPGCGGPIHQHQRAYAERR